MPVKRFRATPEAWIAPSASRELRELVRHRAKLVRLRSSLKCQVHAVLAGAGVPVARTDLFGAQGRELLDRVRLAPAMRARADSCLRLIADIGPDPGRGLRRRDRRCAPVPRTDAADQLGRSDSSPPGVRTTVHRGRITKPGSQLVRWAAIEAVQRRGTGTRIGAYRERVAECRGRNQGKVAAARELVECVFYALPRRTRSPASSSCSSSNNVQCSTSSSRSIGRAGPRPVILPQPGPAAAHLCRPQPTFEIDASRVPSGLNASPFTGATAAPLAVATTPTSIATIRGSST